MMSKIEHIGPRRRTDLPLLSAVIPCYNMEQFVGRALRSVEAQSGPTEVVVVNDCSTDGSDAAIRAWATTATVPCTLITHASNRGLPASVNSGLAEAKGDYLSFLDADDRWKPELWSHHVGALEKLGDQYGAIYGDAKVETASGQTERESFIDYFRPGSRPSGDIFLHLLYEQNFMHVSAVTIRAAAMSATGRFDERIRFQDYDMWIRIASAYRFAYSGSCDVVVTSVPNSMSKTIGDDLARGYLLSWAKWHDDPRVDRKRMRGLAANAVLALAGNREFGLPSAVAATREGCRLYEDRHLALQSSYLLGRVAASRIRNRIGLAGSSR